MLLSFASWYHVPWIAKWDYIIVVKHVNIFDINIMHVPWHIIMINIHWGDKFDFFHDRVYIAKGIVYINGSHPIAPKPSSS